MNPANEVAQRGVQRLDLLVTGKNPDAPELNEGEDNTNEEEEGGL